MLDNNEPMIKLEPGGKAPILSYNVPEPTSYSGKNYIEFDFTQDYFKPNTSKKPQKTLRGAIKNLDYSSIKDRVTSAMKVGFYDPELFSKIKLHSTGISATEKNNPGWVIASVEPITNTLANLDPETVATHMQAGEIFTVYRTMFGDYTYKFIPEPTEARPRLLLVEDYRTSPLILEITEQAKPSKHFPSFRVRKQR